MDTTEQLASNLVRFSHCPDVLERVCEGCQWVYHSGNSLTGSLSLLQSKGVHQRKCWKESVTGNLETAIDVEIVSLVVPQYMLNLKIVTFG